MALALTGRSEAWTAAGRRKLAAITSTTPFWLLMADFSCNGRYPTPKNRASRDRTRALVHFDRGCDFGAMRNVAAPCPQRKTLGCFPPGVVLPARSPRTPSVARAAGNLQVRF